MTQDLKELVLSEMRHVRTFEFTDDVLHGLEVEIQNVMGRLEQQAGSKNYLLRYLMDRVKSR